MARRTDGEKIDALEKLVSTLEERVDRLLELSRKLEQAQARNAEIHADLRRESEREIALLKREVDDIKRSQERWGHRLWMIIAPLIAGACGVLLAYFVGVKK